MRTVNYGLIGYGGIARTRIVPEGFALDRTRFSPLPEARLVAATSRSASRRGAVERLGLKWYEAPEALLADPEIQAVFIATNNLTHAPLAEKALGAGKHCLLEKPVTTTVEDLERLRALAGERRLSLGVNHMMQENLYNRKARSLIKEGRIGTVNDLCLHMEFFYGSTPEEAASWRCADPRELGGPIGDVGSHCLYMAEYLLASSIVKLACVYLPPTLEIAVENGAFIQFAAENGVTGSIRVAFNQPRGTADTTMENLGYEVYGSGGAIRGYATLFQLSGHQGEPVPVRLELVSPDRRETVRLTEVNNIYQEIIRAHARSILEDRPLDGTDALHNLELILACHRSAQGRGREHEIPVRPARGGRRGQGQGVRE